MNAVAPRLRADLLRDRLSRSTERLGSLWRLAQLAHPERPLQRGFARVTDPAGRTIAGVADALAVRSLSIRFADGAVDATVAGTASLGRKNVRGTPCGMTSTLSFGTWRRRDTAGFSVSLTETAAPTCGPRRAQSARMRRRQR